jgi:hypothetical protein
MYNRLVRLPEHLPGHLPLDCIEDRNTLSQQGYSEVGAFDLADCTMR